MIIAIDLSTVPPVCELREAEDFRALKVLIGEAPEHVFLARETFLALAGARAADPAWVAGLDAMLDGARGAGWTDDAGCVRSHIEHEASSSR